MNHFENIILVSSGKGGVGKSTVASNLAVAIARDGYSVGLLDADLFGPSIPLCMGLSGFRTKPEMLNGKEFWRPEEKYGVKIMSLGFFMNREDPAVWRGPMATKAIQQLVDDTQWGEIDYLVVDMPPGTGDIPITVAQKFPDAQALIVITPQQLAAEDGRRALNMYRKAGLNVQVSGIVENMSWFIPEKHPDEKYFLFGKGGGESLANEYAVPLLAQIPLVSDVCEVGDNGKTIFSLNNKIVLKAFESLCNKVLK